MRKLFLFLLLVGMALGCGGGTSGTSSTGGLLEKRFEGRLVDENGKVLDNATVEIASTGQTTKTDADGYFEILAEVPAGPNEVIVTSKEGKTYIIFSFVGPDEETIELRLVSSAQPIDRYKDWTMLVEVTGKGCEKKFFENGGYSSDQTPQTQAEIDKYKEEVQGTGIGLVQWKNVAVGSRCKLTLAIAKGGIPAPGLAYSADIAVCRGDAVNTSGTATLDIAEESTRAGTTDSNGVIEIPFTIEKRPLCKLTVAVPGYGELEKGAFVDVLTEYVLKYFP